jgi:hypothetical protein
MSDFSVIVAKKIRHGWRDEIFCFALFLRGVLENTVYKPRSTNGELAVKARWLAVA